MSNLLTEHTCVTLPNGPLACYHCGVTKRLVSLSNFMEIKAFEKAHALCLPTAEGQRLFEEGSKASK